MRERPTERAFVIQFEPVEGARSRLRGRVERVASSEAIRFRSLKQLVDFIVGTMRRQPTAAACGVQPSIVIEAKIQQGEEK